MFVEWRLKYARCTFIDKKTGERKVRYPVVSSLQGWIATLCGIAAQPWFRSCPEKNAWGLCALA